MISGLRISQICYLACLAAPLVLLGCDRHKEVLNAKHGGVDAGAGDDAMKSSDVAASPGSAAVIVIAPRTTTSGRQPMLAFCFEDNDLYDPQINRIRVARVSGGPKVAYEIAAADGAFLWKEWLVGTVPAGFRLVEGGALSAGVYEVYVDAFVGEGILRMSIDADGKLRSQPWDSFDTGARKTCPVIDRVSPKIVPHRDPVKEGSLGRTMRVREEMRLGRRRWSPGWWREP